MEKEKQGQLANPGSPGKQPLRQWFGIFFSCIRCSLYSMS